METLITTNALMKEDLAIAKNTIMHMQDDNDRLRKDKGLPTQQQQEQLDKEVRSLLACVLGSPCCGRKLTYKSISIINIVSGSSVLAKVRWDKAIASLCSKYVLVC